MASTPPLQITGSPLMPNTPLHGAAYDHESSPRRTSERLRLKRALEDISTPQIGGTKRVARTPSSPRSPNTDLPSPQQTPQRKSRRVQIMSPTSPASDMPAAKPSISRAVTYQPFLSATTTIAEGMLPTPIKTPNKKFKTVNKSNITARALFQDQVVAEEMAPSPRRNRKTRRYNGFSLESFRALNGEEQGGVQIFTDSRDQIPEHDKHEENPFVDHNKQDAVVKKVAGTSKRRKVTETRKMDPQVEEAIRNDDGLVYVFRGKKVYKRFDDSGEEEEEIDAEDLGLLGNIVDGDQIVRPLKTMTRRSIKPTRLFQTEEQKRARELEKEEEAATDIEEALPETSEKFIEKDDQSQPHDIFEETKSRARSTRSGVGNADIGNNVKPVGKKGSPFDSWKRLKPGSASSSTAVAKPSRGRKRAASESFEESPSIKA